MIDENSFERVRDEIEARQRSIFWPDYLRATRNVYNFLWNGDLKPRLVQRIGLALFALQFLLSGIFLIFILPSDEVGWFTPYTVIGVLSVLFSLRVLRNALLRTSERKRDENADEVSRD